MVHFLTHEFAVPNIMYGDCSVTLRPGFQVIYGTDIQLNDKNDGHWFYTEEGQPKHHIGECKQAFVSTICVNSYNDDLSLIGLNIIN